MLLFFFSFCIKKSDLFSLFQVGELKSPLNILPLEGIYGSKYDTPKDCILVAINKCTNAPIAIPSKPAKYPRLYIQND